MEGTSNSYKSINADTKLFINEDGIRELCSYIDKCSDNISLIFNSVDDEMNNLMECYKSSSENAIKTSYDDFSKNYKLIKENIKSYSEDLNALVIKVKSGDEEIALSISRDFEDIETKIKTIKNKEE